MFKINKLPATIDIGFTGEHQFREIQIDMTPWMELMPDGVPSIVHIRPGETKDDAYKAETTFINNILTWKISMSDLGSVEGRGIAQVWLEDVTGLTVNHRGKSTLFFTVVNKCAGEADAIPASQTNWEGKLALKIDKTSIANNLTTTEEGKVLDARQGKALDDAKVGWTDVQNDLNATTEGKVLDARQGKALDDKKVDINTGLAEGKFLQTDAEGKAVWGSPAAEATIRDAAEGWLADHVSQGQTLAVDNTLLLSGYAADSKVTGNKITELKSAIDYRDLTLDKFIDYKPILFKQGYYYTTPDVGGTSSEATSTNYIGAKGAVSEGDTVTFKIGNTNGETSNIIACALLDADSKVVSKHRMINGGTINIPQGVSYIVINNRYSTLASGYYAYIGTTISDLIHNESICKKGMISGGTSENPINLNSITDIGFYFMLGSDLDPTTLLNAPCYDDGFANFVVMHYGNYKLQLFITKEHFYWRRGGASTWENWQESTNKTDFDAMYTEFDSVTMNTRNLWLWGNQTVTGYKRVTQNANISAGTYTLSALCTKSGTGNVRMVFYNNDEEVIANPYIAANTRNNTTFTLSENCTSIFVYSGPSSSGADEATWTDIQLEQGSIATDYIKPITAADYKLKEEVTENKRYFGLHDFQFTDMTENGLTFSWVDGKSRCHVSGTASDSTNNSLYDNMTKLARDFHAGDKIGVLFSTTNVHIAFRIRFYKSDGSGTNSSWLTGPGFISIPNDAVGMKAYIGVLSGYTVDGYCSIPFIFKQHEQATYLPFKPKKPLYVSFVDDDTSNDGYVEKYYYSCKHNGIVGAFAVITGNCKGTNPNTSINKLLQYEYDGFNMALHCHAQENYMSLANFDAVRTRENIFTCIREFDELGLRNAQNLWIIPYGVSTELVQNLAKDFGFDMAFTTLGDSINYLTDNNKYKMRRCTLHPITKITDDTDPTEAGSLAKAKARVDELVASDTGGWAIFTTHYNEWSGVTWDSTEDTNGYPVGYERFNTLVDYVKSKGCEIVSLAQGASFMKPFYDRNSTNW